MAGLRRNGIIRLASTAAAVLLTVTALLWWAGEQGQQAQATAQSSVIDTCPDLYTSQQGDGISTVWTSTDPVTRTIVLTDDLTIWNITQYSVTITFFINSFTNQEGAVFTFTPKAELTGFPPLPATQTAYCFELEGNYIFQGELANRVSLNQAGIKIEMNYDPEELAGIDETSLEMYHLRLGTWERESAIIDPTNDRIEWTRDHLGIFCLGGYRSRVFMPLVSQ